MPVPAGAIAERRLIDRLMRARAFTPDTAAPLDDLRWAEGRRLQRLLGKGVIREHGPGRYYIDGPALADRITFRRRARMIAIFVVVIAGLTAAIFGGLANSRIIF